MKTHIVSVNTIVLFSTYNVIITHKYHFKKYVLFSDIVYKKILCRGVEMESIFNLLSSL